MKDFLIGLGFCIVILVCSVGLAVCLTVIEKEDSKQLEHDIREIVKDEIKE